MGPVLDRFQEESVRLIEEGRSVLVSAPTGAGKTLIAEHIMRKCLQSGEKVIYTSPIKALSNQKFRDFSREFPESTGIVTGDVSINPQAPLLIMTTEILRNRLFTENYLSKKYSWVIFDEIHYIDEPERGTVWEECLMFLPRGIKFLGLSATLPNIDEFASWISLVREEDVCVVREEKRPVPLKFYFVRGKKVSTDPDSIFRKRDDHGGNAPGRTVKKRIPGDNDVISLILGLRTRDRLPAIYFTMNRRRTVSLAESLLGFDFLDEHEKRETGEVIHSVAGRPGIADNPGFDDIIPLLRKGIAYHHAGMLPAVKELVEKLFTSGLIRIVFATATFSLGINMPARTVILDELKKRSGRSFRIIPRRDFFQMGGRAGRRGIDPIGYVYSFIDRTLRPGAVQSLIRGESEPVSSRFDLSYAGLLNLYEKYGEDIYSVYFRSFRHFQEQKHGDEMRMTGLRKKINVLKELKYIDSGKVTDSGITAREIHGYELTVGEVFRSGIIRSIYPKDLVYLTLALVYEPRAGAGSALRHGRSKYLNKITRGLVSRVHRAEKRNDVSDLSPSFNFDLTGAAELWMKDEPFFLCVYHSGIDEGDLVRYFRMAVQVLREMLGTRPDGETIAKIRKAISFLNRGLVDAEKELRGEYAGDQ